MKPLTKKIILFSIAAVILMILAIVLSISYDEVIITPKQELVTEIDGKIRKYDLLVYSPVHRVAKVVSEFFCTAAIAILIYFGIEYALHATEKEKEEKERAIFLEASNQKAVEQVFKKFIPDVLFDAIYHDVLNQPFITENVNWEYTIEDGKDHYKVIQLITADFKNTGTTSEKLPFRLSVYQNSNNTSWCDLVRVVKFGVSGEEIEILSEGREEIEQKSEPVIGIKKMRVIEEEIEPKGLRRVTYRIVNQYQTKYIQDFHFSNYSITELKIRVNTLEECEFSAIGTFSQSLKEASKDGNVIKYKELKGILKGQSFIFFIEPKSNGHSNIQVASVEEPLAVIKGPSDEDLLSDN